MGDSLGERLEVKIRPGEREDWEKDLVKRRYLVKD